MKQTAFATHEVFNQSPPFEDVDLFALDRPLEEAVAAFGGAGGREQELSGVREALGLGRDGRARARREREYAEAQNLRFDAAIAATRSNFIRRITS